MPRESNIFDWLSSYFRDVTVEVASSAYNPKLEVVLSNGKYKLNSDDAIYSYEDKYTSYGNALHEIRELIPSFNNALVLGTGLGSIPYMLIKTHHFTGTIESIDIDQEIIRLAKKYFPLQPLPSQIQFILSDGFDFANRSEKKYDLIAVDLFIDTDVPVKFHSRAFLMQLKKMVNRNGVLLFSRLKSRMHSEHELNANIRNIYPEGRDIDTGGNLILCWRAS